LVGGRDCKVLSLPAKTLAVKHFRCQKQKNPVIADGAFSFLIWSGLRESNPFPAPAMLRKAPALLDCAWILHALLCFALQWFRHFFDSVVSPWPYDYASYHVGELVRL